MSAATRHLILVKHSLPIVVPGVPAAQWVLSDEGRARCDPLADRLRGYHPARIAASDEPKAAETARLLAASLGHPAPVELDHDLREHERTPADFFASDAAFRDAVRRFFAAPATLVFGQETAAAAEARFTAAIDRLLAATPDGDLIVVAHGTVISLFVAAHAGLDPFPLWHSLQLPSSVALPLPSLRSAEVCPTVA